MMQVLFASGRIAGLILALTSLEAVILLAFRRRTGLGIPPADLLPMLLAGAGLLAAMWSALAGLDWPWTAACLLFALLAHLADLRRRWRN